MAGLLIYYLDFEVLYSRSKETEVIIAGYVLIEAGTDSFGVAHLTENSSVGRCNTFYCIVRVVGIEVNISRRLAVKVNILRSNLSVFNKLLDKLFGSYKSTFAVGNRNVNNITDVYVLKPG